MIAAPAYHIHRIGTPLDTVSGQFYSEQNWITGDGWVSFAESDRISFDEWDGNSWELPDDAEWYPVWTEK